VTWFVLHLPCDRCHLHIQYACPAARLTCCVLLSTLLHGGVLGGVRTTAPVPALPNPHVLNVELRAPTYPAADLQGQPSGGAIDSRTIEARSLPKMREHRQSLMGSAKNGDSDPRIANVVRQAPQDLLETSLAEARRIGAEYARAEERLASQGGDAAGSGGSYLPPAWVGAYRGAWSGGGDSGQFRLQVTKEGAIAGCIVLHRELGDLHCSGGVDRSGDFIVVIGTVGIELQGRVSGAQTVQVSGTWASRGSLFAFGGTFNGVRVGVR